MAGRWEAEGATNLFGPKCAGGTSRGEKSNRSHVPTERSYKLQYFSDLQTTYTANAIHSDLISATS